MKTPIRWRATLSKPPNLRDWLHSPLGAYTLAWEQAQYDQCVANVFGYHALQLGVPELDTLRGNRMPHRWVACTDGQVQADSLDVTVQLLTHAAALPFPAQSLDLVTLPHTLEFSADPHQVLREVERVLMPEGRLVLTCFNPWSLWGLRRRALPPVGELIAHRRLLDWLKLLGFELALVQHGAYLAPVQSLQRLQQMAWLDRWGARWWPGLGGLTLVVAIKRVHGMRLLGPAWKPHLVPTGVRALAQKPLPPSSVKSS